MTSPSSSFGIGLDQTQASNPVKDMNYLSLKEQALERILSGDRHLAEKGANYLNMYVQVNNNSALDSELVTTVDKAIEEENLLALELMMKKNLITPAKLQEACCKDKILELYATVLVSNLQQSGQKDSLLTLLKEAKVCDQALEKYPDLFKRRVIKGLFLLNWILPTDLERLMNHSKILALFSHVLHEALTDKDRALIDYFKNNSLLIPCFDQALKEKNGFVIRQLLNRHLIGIDLLKGKLQDPETQLILKEQFKESCENVVEYASSVYVLLQAGISYDQQDIRYVVKSGNYCLLQQFEAAGADIVAPIFDLVSNGQTAALRKLLEHQTPNFFPDSPSTTRPGLDPNFRNQEGKTLLVEAVENDKEGIVELLLEWGANSLILSPGKLTVFQLAKGKSSSLRQLLYHPNQRLSNVHHGIGPVYSVSELREEEIVLKQRLGKLCQGQPVTDYYCLFIKVNSIALAILKSQPFCEKMRQSYQEAYQRNQQNVVYCWARLDKDGRYPIPQQLVPNHKSMSTLAFAIYETQQAANTEDVVSLQSPKPKKYRCRQIESTYQSENPSQEYGFKYVYEGIETHGHGANPEAARRAFLEHKDEVYKLSYQKDSRRVSASEERGQEVSRWVTPPDLTEEMTSLRQLEKEREGMFNQEVDRQQKLEKLAKQVSTFVEKVELAVATRYKDKLSQNEANKQSCIDICQEIGEELANLPIYIRTTDRVEEWKSLIQRQRSVLTNLEKKLLEAKPLNSVQVDHERKVIGNHLQDLLEMVTGHPVTSADKPTLKICYSWEVTPTIFALTPPSLIALKKAMCHLMGSDLVHILPPNQTNTFLSTLLQQQAFRGKILNQLQLEAQFIVTHSRINDPASMQDLARHLAMLHDTSQVLEAMPPEPSRGIRMRNPVFKQILADYLFSYVNARNVLDRFWQIVCFEKEILDLHLDEMLTILNQRLLLIDQENRQEEKEHFLYPHIDIRDPKHLLDKQLFLLQTALLIGLSYQASIQPDNHPYLASTIELIQLRLKPNAYGTGQEKSKFFRFFIGNLIDDLKKMGETVKSAWQASASKTSPFQKLNALIGAYQFPKKENIAKAMTEAFQKLSPAEPSPKFDSELAKLINLVEEVKKEMEVLSVGYKEGVTESKETVRLLQASLNEADSVLQSLSTHSSTLNSLELLSAMRRQSVLAEADQRKIEEICLSESIQKIKGSISHLKRIIQERFKLDDSEEEKMRENNKKFQQETASLISSITVYLDAKKDFVDPAIPYQQNCSKILNEILPQLQSTAIGKELSKLIGAIGKQGRADSKSISSLKGFIKQMQIFLKSEKGKEMANSCNPQIALLQSQIDSWSNAQLPSIITGLLEKAKACQEIFYGSYIKQLIQINNRLKLGIHAQTYYTAQNGNMTYYLWDGEPFSSPPYHTANETHIPLEMGMEQF